MAETATPVTEVEDHELEQVNQFLLADRDTDLIPVERQRLGVIKAVKISEEEWAKIEQFIEWLTLTENPETGQPYLAGQTFSAFIKLAMNVTFRYFYYLSTHNGADG